MSDQTQQTPPPDAAAGGRQIRLHVDEKDMRTSYANGFRTNITNEELIVDFGLNLAAPPQPQQGQDQTAAGQMVFHVNDRVIMNYYTAKRLALSLGQVIRRHEQQFGELQLNAADRTAGDGRPS